MKIDLPKNEISVNFECNAIDLPDYFEANGLPIINTKVLKAIQSTGIDNYQCFPLNINFADAKVSGYGLLNVIGRIDCIDREKSDFSSFGPSIARMFSLILDTSKIRGALMFREHNYHDVIFICEQLKVAIEELKVTGCEILPADGWSDSSRF